MTLGRHATKSWGWEGVGKKELGTERREMIQQGSCWRTYQDILEVKYQWFCH